MGRCLFIAFNKARKLLEGIYDEPNLTTMVSETLHAIVAHAAEEKCLIIEAGIVKIDELLKTKLKYSPIEPFLEVTVKIEGEMEHRLFDSYTL